MEKEIETLKKMAIESLLDGLILLDDLRCKLKGTKMRYNRVVLKKEEEEE